MAMPDLSAVEVAQLFTKLCDRRTLGGILGSFLSCGDNDEDNLSDDEINWANQLFHSIQEIADEETMRYATDGSVASLCRTCRHELPSVREQRNRRKSVIRESL